MALVQCQLFDKWTYLLQGITGHLWHTVYIDGEGVGVAAGKQSGSTISLQEPSVTYSAMMHHLDAGF